MTVRSGRPVFNPARGLAADWPRAGALVAERGAGCGVWVGRYAPLGPAVGARVVRDARLSAPARVFAGSGRVGGSGRRSPQIILRSGVRVAVPCDGLGTSVPSRSGPLPKGVGAVFALMDLTGRIAVGVTVVVLVGVVAVVVRGFRAR